MDNREEEVSRWAQIWEDKINELAHTKLPHQISSTFEHVSPYSH